MRAGHKLALVLLAFVTFFGLFMFMHHHAKQNYSIQRAREANLNSLKACIFIFHLDDQAGARLELRGQAAAHLMGGEVKDACQTQSVRSGSVTYEQIHTIQRTARSDFHRLGPPNPKNPTHLDEEEQPALPQRGAGRGEGDHGGGVLQQLPDLKLGLCFLGGGLNGSKVWGWVGV